MNVPCSSTPAGPCARPLPRCGVVFRHLDSVDSRHFSHFGAQLHGPLTRCLRFAGWVAPPLRKTRFRMAGQPFRAGLAIRWVLNERFQVIPFSFPRLCLAHPNNAENSTVAPSAPSISLFRPCFRGFCAMECQTASPRIRQKYAQRRGGLTYIFSQACCRYPIKRNYCYDRTARTRAA